MNEMKNRDILKETDKMFIEKEPLLQMYVLTAAQKIVSGNSKTLEN